MCHFVFASSRRVRCTGVRRIWSAPPMMPQERLFQSITLTASIPTLRKTLIAVSFLISQLTAPGLPQSNVNITRKACQKRRKSKTLILNFFLSSAKATDTRKVLYSSSMCSLRSGRSADPRPAEPAFCWSAHTCGDPQHRGENIHRDSKKLVMMQMPVVFLYILFGHSAASWFVLG